MVEKWIIGGICHFINRYAKANYKYVRDYDKNKESVLMGLKIIPIAYLKINIHNLNLKFHDKELKLKTLKEKLVANLYDKNEYVTRIRNLKQTLDY